MARAFSDTFAGIRPVDVAPFVAAQLAGAASALLVCHWLLQESGGRSAAGATAPAPAE
jgi:hypothetical protein